MKKILYITKHNPWGTGGGSTASKMYLNAFKKVFGNCHIDLCVSDSIDPISISQEISESDNVHLIYVKSRDFFSRLISPLTGVLHRYQNVALNLLKTGTYAYCVFDHSSIGGSIINFVPPKTKTIVVHHNFEPDFFRDNTPNPIIKNLLLPSVRRCERNSFMKCDINIFLTNEDLLQFNKNYGDNGRENLVLGLFEDCNRISITAGNLNIEPPTILITGSLNNIQNTDGIRYFFNDLYSYIPANYKIIIAGKDPTDEVKNLVGNKDNVELIANPPIMQEIIGKGNIFLSPARLGGGIKVRITDGLKAGLPIIAHTTSARGYGAFIDKGYFRSFNTPEEFRSALIRTVQDIYNRKFTSQQILDLYLNIFSMDSAVKSLLSVI